MKQILFIIAAIIGLGLLFSFFTGNQGQGGVINTSPRYATASSTLATVGADISIEALATNSGRSYARLCNDGATGVYLSFGASAITATTSADQVIEANECYEIDQDNLYTGAVQAMQDTASTTTFFITELTD